MAYVEIVGDDEVIYYINSPHRPEGRWTFDDVLRGDADRSIYIPFEQSVLEELRRSCAAVWSSVGETAQSVDSLQAVMDPSAETGTPRRIGRVLGVTG